MGIRQKSIRLKRSDITNNLWLIHSVESRSDLEAMALIQLDKELVLLGLESRFDWNDIFALLEPLGSYSRLSTIFLLESHPACMEMIDQLKDYSFHPNVYLPYPSWQIGKSEEHPSYLHFYDQGTPSITREKDYEFEWIQSPFITTPDSCMIYDKRHRWLFSNRLFDQSPQPLESVKDMMSLINLLKQQVPSSLFLHPIIEKCRPYPVDLVLTKHGQVYSPATWQELLDLAGSTFFYNNAKVVKGPFDSGLPYRECIHQVIQKLREVFGDTETKEVLTHSTLPLATDSFNLTTSGFVSHASWHHLFETIYLIKGEKWLNICEPMIQKIEAVEGIEKPSIYSSLIIQAKRTADALGDTNIELKRQLSDLNERFIQTEMRLTKDGLTGLYNELFLMEYLRGEVKKIIQEPDAHQDLCLIGITIDNLMNINTKYTKEIGDETLINATYLLEQIRTQEDMLFKRNGPGFFWLHLETISNKGDQLASEIQSRIAKSDLFIEPITVSLAIVRLSEFSIDSGGDECCIQMMKVVKTRLELLYSKGPNALINQMTKIDHPQNGSILIVDDEEIQRKLLSAYFLKANYLVDVASDGIEALEKAKSMPYDAIIAKKNLPKLDGLSLKNKLNDIATTANQYFILTTFKKTPDTILSANRFNVDSVMEKPLIFDELLGQISRHARRKGS